MQGRHGMLGTSGMMGAREITVDTRGKLVQRQGQLQLGWALGDLAELSIEPLPEGTEPTWKDAHDVTISRTTSEYIFPSLLSWHESEEQFSAKEKANYTVESVEGNRVKIKKRYELKTDVATSGKPRVELVGEGDLIFDTARGVFTAYSGSFTLSSRQRNVAVEIPLKVSYELVEAAEPTKSAPPAAPAKVEPEKPITGAQLDQLTADLESGDMGRVLLATNRLGSQKPQAANARIAAALAKVLREDQSPIVRSNAAQGATILVHGRNHARADPGPGRPGSAGAHVRHASPGHRLPRGGKSSDRGAVEGTSRPVCGGIRAAIDRQDGRAGGDQAVGLRSGRRAPRGGAPPHGNRDRSQCGGA